MDHENGFDDDCDEFVTINKNNSPLMSSAPPPPPSPSTADSSSLFYGDSSASSFDHFSSGGPNILEISVKHNDYADEETESQQAAAAIKAIDNNDGYSSLDAQYISDFVLGKEANNVVPVEEESLLKRRRMSDGDDDEEDDEENRTAPDDDEDEVAVSRPASKRQKFSSEIDVNRKWCQQQHENESQRSDDDSRFHNLTNVTDHKTRRHLHKAAAANNSVSSFYEYDCDDNLSNSSSSSHINIDNSNDDRQFFHHHQKQLINSEL